MTKPNDSVTRAVLGQLGDYLRKALPDLVQIILEWPESNQELKLPSASISIAAAPFVNEMPYIFNESALVGTTQTKDVKYVIGNYEFSLQLDLWERSNEQRDELYEKFFTAFNSNLPQPGLNLTLVGYHNTICSYEIVDYLPEDSEISAQTKQWRATIKLNANCKAIGTKRESIITQVPELTLETPDEISS